MMTTIGRYRMARPWLRSMLAMLVTGWLLTGLLPHPAMAAMKLDIDEELRVLRDGHAKVHIGEAQYRFAVFSFDDPDGTGLGNAVASILSHDLLMNSKVSSVGVLRYVGELGRASGDAQLRYFDKVEPLIESQGVQVALWGTIRRTGDQVRIDSFTQLSPSVMRDAFSYSFRLPAEYGGGGRLVHRIGPDRMLTQRLTLSADSAASLGLLAASLDRLHATANDSARSVGQLPMDSVYYVQKRKGDWAQVGMQSGQSGWLRAGGFCTGDCAPLLAVSRFASSLMAYDQSGSLPDKSELLAPDAAAFIDQLWAVEVLNRTPPQSAEQAALAQLKRWCPGPDAGAGNTQALPPGGAATCNLRALVQLVGPTRKGANQQLTPKLVRSVTDELAVVSMSDPRHVPTLENLATLFGILGDGERARLARQLAVEAGSAGEAGQAAKPVSSDPTTSHEARPGARAQ